MRVRDKRRWPLAVPLALAVAAAAETAGGAAADAGRRATAADPPVARAADDAAEGAREGDHADDRDGPLVVRGPARPLTTHRVCSLRLPICVHGDRSPASALLATLADAERAWDVLTGALALPPPDADPETRAYDLYLVDGVEGGGVTAASLRDPRSRVDRASAYTLVDRGLEGCARAATIAREVARAALFRASPATDEGAARAETAYLARLAVPCALGAIDGVDAFQASPDRAIVDAWPEADPRVGQRYDRGAALFFWWLDASFSAQPGGLVRALWALTATTTPRDAWRWKDEPDAFDVLTVTFRNALTSGSTVDDLLLDFAAARALLGPSDDGTELPEARPLGDALRPRLDWEIDWPTTPRRLAATRGVAPTGAAYVAVRHAGAKAGARLRLEATWEEHAKMRWVAIKRDAAGREKGRVRLPVMERATDAQITIADLDDVDSVLVVVTNAGDPTAPFDPDDRAWEPHGWLLTVAEE